MDKEKVTEELVRQNGNQAAAVMADYAGQGGQGGQGGGGSLEVITPKIVVIEEETPEEEAFAAGIYAVLQKMPEAGKAYNLPFFDRGMMMPVFIVSIDADTEEKKGVCLFLGYTGSASYNTGISFSQASRYPTLVLAPIPEELQSSLGGTVVANIQQSAG